MFVEDQAMQKLVDGIHKFQKDVFCSQEQFFQRLVNGQEPLALFITCSDSRIDPNMLTQTRPGELFIMRNAGNIVPPYGSASSGEAATIEYAVSVLGVEDIVICGHSHCGAMNALLNPGETGRLPAVRQWLGHADATSRIISENYTHLFEGRERLAATVEENVLVQLENLRTHPAVLAALGRKCMTLHGWVYEFESGQVFVYDTEQEQFASVGHPSLQAEALTSELRAN